MLFTITGLNGLEKIQEASEKNGGANKRENLSPLAIHMG